MDEQVIPGTRVERIPVVVLGATGVVGQRLVAALADHPWFSLAGLAASERSAGARYGDVVRWSVETPPPSHVLDMSLAAPAPELFPGARIAFSALPASDALRIEPLFARAGALVSSNASAFRMDSDIPLIVPEINAEHLAALDVQRRKRRWSGAIITNPNCSTIGLTLALAPLRQFDIKRVLVTTLQAASGAGYPGVPSLDLIDNVIPYIAGEEEKIESETRKILGGWSDEAFQPVEQADLRLSAHCTRVPVRDGHLETVSIELGHACEPEALARAWQGFTSEPQRLGLPTAPAQPVVYLPGEDRPQPIRDRMLGSGMTVSVGRLRPCDILQYKFVCLSHNTIRGAAGAALLNAELAYARGTIR